jgi:hypothetical protein
MYRQRLYCKPKKQAHNNPAAGIIEAFFGSGPNDKKKADSL